MDLVDEEHVTVLQVGEQRSQITGPRQHGPRGDAQAGSHFGGDDAGQRRLAQTGGAGEEDVVHRLVPLAGRLQHDAEVLDQLGLADELRQRARSEPNLLELLVLIGSRRVYDARVSGPHIVGVGTFSRDGQDLAASPRAHRLASSRSASRSISSTPTSSRSPSSAPRISSGA